MMLGALQMKKLNYCNLTPLQRACQHPIPFFQDLWHTVKLASRPSAAVAANPQLGFWCEAGTRLMSVVDGWEG